MQYLKAKTGKIVHHQSEPLTGDSAALMGDCPCGKEKLLPVTEGEARSTVFDKGGKFCDATVISNAAVETNEATDAHRHAHDHQAAKNLHVASGYGIEKPILPSDRSVRRALARGMKTGRPAARRKAPASLWTHRVHVDQNGVMFRWPIGNPSLAVPARPRDRARVGGKR